MKKSKEKINNLIGGEVNRGRNPGMKEDFILVTSSKHFWHYLTEKYPDLQMKHLHISPLSSPACVSQPLTTSLYLRHILKKKGKALSFLADKIEGNTGWGLHFVENLDSLIAVTVMFVVSPVLEVVFTVFWGAYKRDVHDAFGVAAYVASVMTLAVMSWKMWAA